MSMVVFSGSAFASQQDQDLAQDLAQEPAQVVRVQTLDVSVTDLDKTRGGDLVIYIFQESGFPKQHNLAWRNYQYPVKDFMGVVIIEVPEGEFAIKVHHDEDESGALTKNWTGIFPAEGLGFSSGARIRFGPPSFNKAKMQYPESGQVDIPMVYP